MTFLVTFTLDSALFLELLPCLSPLAYILVTIIMERCFPTTQMTWTFPIGCNGHVPDDYFPDVIKKNWLYPDLTISIWLPASKLQNSVLSIFRAICRKRFRQISEPTVSTNISNFVMDCLLLYLLAILARIFFSQACESYLMFGTSVGELKLYNIQTAEESVSYSCHNSPLTHVEPSKDGRLVLTSGDWDTPLSALWTMTDLFEMKYV